MLDPNKMTSQYERILRHHPTQWYFLSPGEPRLTWRHRYKKVREPGTMYLPQTFPSHPVRHKFLIKDISTAHFKFTKFKPHDLFIDITSGDDEYQISDGGAASFNGAHRLRIYESKFPNKNGVLYMDYPQLNSLHNKGKNLRIMMYHLCEFTNAIMSLIS